MGAIKMKKLQIKGVNEDLYYEKLSNGLEIYVVPKDTLNDVYAAFTTKYGGVNNEFIPIDKKTLVSVPNGIAHFLEHKMFEQKDGKDPFTFFSESGTYCNASTNYYSTSYIFSGNKMINENIEFLLNFVQSPYFTDKNVEKEKGIIEQEIKMYEDSPDRIIYENLIYNMFINNPAKYSIAGTVEDIKTIKKEDLYTCYNTFYNPNNMFIIITGNVNPEEVIKVIIDNQSKKKFKYANNIKLKEYNEPDKVEKKYDEKSMNIDIPYLSLGIKIPLKKFKDMDVRKRNLYFAIIFYYLFGETSLFNEKITSEKLIDSELDIEMLDTDTHKIVILICKTRKLDELVKSIKDNLKNIAIDEEFIERRKKVFISSLVYSFEGSAEINRIILDSIITYKEYNVNTFDVMNSLNKKELDMVISSIDLTNTSTYIIKSNKE
jgi:predicted Zn-dependent peptidase